MRYIKKRKNLFVKSIGYYSIITYCIYLYYNYLTPYWCVDCEHLVRTS